MNEQKETRYNANLLTSIYPKKHVYQQRFELVRFAVQQHLGFEIQNMSQRF